MCAVPVYSFIFTFCSNLSISIFVRSLQECFGLLIAQVSPVCSEMLENKPTQRKQSKANTFTFTNLMGYMFSVRRVEMM